jgi:hypothetical protein
LKQLEEQETKEMLRGFLKKGAENVQSQNRTRTGEEVISVENELYEFGDK